MTVAEFNARTGYTPSDNEWRAITRDYMRNDWESKDMFCRRWLIERGQYSRIGELIRKRNAGVESAGDDRD